VKRVTPPATRGLWAIRVHLPEKHGPDRIAAVEAAIEPMGAALSTFETAGGGWDVEALCERRPDAAAVQAAMRRIGAPPAVLAYLPPKDWVAESQRLQSPLRIGRFFIHGAHVKGRPPRGSVPLQIDASLAFGTGRHETTRGCLLALDRLARAGRRVRRPLDLGCGSGILAMAMARLWEALVLAVDTDLNAVAVARENLRLNGLADRVRALRAHGFGAPAVRRAAPFDLIIANILAGPLRRLARGFGRHLAPGGRAIMSGLMIDQEAEVIAAQERHGLALRRRTRLNGWSVLEFERPRTRPVRRTRRPHRIRGDSAG
jgi:ribosomal protein L11 methyltransferase